MQELPIASEDTKACTDRKPAQPGKKWVKVKKTRMSNVDGYLQAEDYTSFEEQDDIPTDKKPDPRAGPQAAKVKPAATAKPEKKLPSTN